MTTRTERLLSVLAIFLALLSILVALADWTHYEDGSGVVRYGQIVTIVYCLPGEYCWEG